MRFQDKWRTQKTVFFHGRSHKLKQLSLPLKDIYPIIAETIQNGGETYLTVRGNSMSPFLADGRDQAVFASHENRMPRRGDIVFYQRDSGQFVMHRVYKAEKDGTYTMLGDVQWTLEKGIRPDQVRAFVVRVVRKGKEISCEKGGWHFLMKLYLLRIRFPRLARLGLKVLSALLKVKRKIV